ncbi:unnamed protein product, partial [Mesorhabditis spiculigera]
MCVPSSDLSEPPIYPLPPSSRPAVSTAHEVPPLDPRGKKLYSNLYPTATITILETQTRPRWADPCRLNRDIPYQKLAPGYRLLMRGWDCRLMVGQDVLQLTHPIAHHHPFLSNTTVDEICVEGPYEVQLPKVVGLRTSTLCITDVEKCGRILRTLCPEGPKISHVKLFFYGETMMLDERLSRLLCDKAAEVELWNLDANLAANLLDQHTKVIVCPKEADGRDLKKLIRQVLADWQTRKRPDAFRLEIRPQRCCPDELKLFEKKHQREDDEGASITVASGLGAEGPFLRITAGQ